MSSVVIKVETGFCWFVIVNAIPTYQKDEWLALTDEDREDYIQGAINDFVSTHAEIDGEPIE